MERERFFHLIIAKRKDHEGLVRLLAAVFTGADEVCQPQYFGVPVEWLAPKTKQEGRS